MLLKQHSINKDSLFIVESSNNDIFNQMDNEQTDDNKLVDQLIKTLGSVLDKLINSGSQKILVANVVSLSKTPRFVNYQTAWIKKIVDNYNNQLNNLLKNKKSKYVHLFNLEKELNNYIELANKRGVDTKNAVVHKNLDRVSLLRSLSLFGTGEITMSYINNKSVKDLNNTFFLDDVHTTLWVQNLVGKDMHQFIKNW
ncbi:hypothetical protein P344_00790 [Spiroplasma mirum ATCC 29335]|uniref:Uncharacterized protein n=1 Tax=Spiroplasma mirum ATCC 29335 TaxID=838561 RepID=W0GKC7_9MOLU|nr:MULTISPECIES: SGNH/GDSL hydrolase family protein [Spiroplasma]AHF60597.1 hypothetical protein SMM_0130 [Spiroplasma mirum ATCC 29335]AHI57531.1 hypothetical protein P344_00790 [Spiroplasma mirum ATCC 29335]AKM52715.1 hypothetical protein SATRI_v1c01380 [Spiroplasma atrichopogonis]